MGCWQIEMAGIRLPRANATILLANQRETKHEAERSCPERQKREWLHLWHHKVKYWYFKTLWCALVRTQSALEKRKTFDRLEEFILALSEQMSIGCKPSSYGFFP